MRTRHSVTNSTRSRGAVTREWRAKRVIVGLAAALGLWIPTRTIPAQVPAGATCTTPSGGDANRPHPVCEVQAQVTRGPYLHAPTDTSATITWMTDIPARACVEYGAGTALTGDVCAVNDGMATVGTLHTVRLPGLRPGERYQYRVVNMPVLTLPAYWPTTGTVTRSATFAFTTFDARKPTATFASISDTHESVPRIDALMARLDWTTLDFLVHTGDAFNGVTSETQLWDNWLTPLIRTGLRQSTPMLFARGNHETRGPFARELPRYVPVEEGRTYYARDIGPVHILALDTGEDKPDSTQVYAGLNRMEAFRDTELQWFTNHAATNARMANAPFRVVVMHQPTFGWGWNSAQSNAKRAEWVSAANASNIDLVIAGHDHRFSLTPAGVDGNTYPVVVVGQDQIATVHASMTELRVRVTDAAGKEIGALTIPRRR